MQRPEGMHIATAPRHGLHDDRTGKGLTIALWIVQVALALMFFMAGTKKLTSDPMMVEVFATVGLGQWFRYVTGALEVLGALMLLVPRLAGWGASLLSCVMVGALIAHATVLHGSPALPVVLLVGLIFVVWGRRDDIAAFVRARAGEGLGLR
jgi:uncharacterized membrane protein YphA (DoxX/SURF4 family)